MKKTILQTLSTLFVVGILFSSCLGDNNGEYKESGALTYIKRVGYMGEEVVAVTNSGPFASPFLTSTPNLEIGRFYYFDYTINTKDGATSDGIYYARNVSFASGKVKPVPQGDPVRWVSDGEYDSKKIEVYPTNINVKFYKPVADNIINGANDQWVFAYEAMVSAEDKEIYDSSDDRDNITLVASILEKDQTISDGNNNTNKLADNKIVVRLHLERRQSIGTPASKDKVYHSGTMSVDMRVVRNHLSKGMSSTNEKIVPGVIQFKYYLEPSDNNPKGQERLLGNLDDERPSLFLLEEVDPS